MKHENGDGMKGIFAACALLAALAGAGMAAADVVPLVDWEFSRNGSDWQRVSVPHDWAIRGPFDK